MAAPPGGLFMVPTLRRGAAASRAEALGFGWPPPWGGSAALEPRRSSSGTETAIPDESGNEVQSARTGIPPRLVQDLTAQKSAAIGAKLMSRPDVALAAVVHCLTLRVWYSGSDTDSCLELLRGPFSLRRSLTAPEACHGFGAVEQERERLGDRLPGNPADLWQW